MNRLFCTVLACLTASLIPVSALADKVDTLIKAEMKQHQIAGMALIIKKNDRIIKKADYGVANLEWNVPVDKDTVFEIGSVTKQFTAACILMLVQEDKVSLDEKISKYLTNTPDAWVDVTVRHLLTHTSGIQNYTVLNGFELRNRLTQEKFIELLAATPMIFKPGDSWAYCNSGYSLLGYIIENRSGKDYWTYLREHILLPLGMNETRSRLPKDIIYHRASGYELTNHISINRDYDLTDIFSAGEIVSCSADLNKWDSALNGNRLLTQASKDQWWTPVKLNNGKTKAYGFGWFLDPLDGHKNIGHNGSTSGFSCSIQRYPDDHLSIILLSNADEMGVSTIIAKKIAPLYLSAKK